MRLAVSEVTGQYGGLSKWPVPAGADVEAARGSAGTDPASADLAVSIVGRLFRLAPQLTDLLDLGAREYGMGFAAAACSGHSRSRARC